MPNTPKVTGVVVDPATMPAPDGTERRATPEILPVPLPPGTAKDSVITVKSPETIQGERLARAEQVKAAELKTASQRKVNLVWEYTQAGIAALICLANVAYIFLLLFKTGDPSLAAEKAAALLANGFFLVVGFYFGRTNHQTQGGSGTHEPLQQSGR